MKRLTQLFEALDQTNRTAEKVAALERYFADAPPADAAWALSLLTGRRARRAVSGRKLGDWAAAEAGLPPWLLGECHEATGDLEETLALVLPDHGAGTELPLHMVMTQRVLPLQHLPEAEQRALLVRSWREFDRTQRFLLHKLIAGNFRVGVAATLVIRAAAAVAGVPPAVMAHRLMGAWSPTADDCRRLLSPAGSDADAARPYPFMLAHALEVGPARLGPPADWQAEWKWDGIRAQLIRRGGEALLWSRGQELVNVQFPEIAQAAGALPEGTVLDGELLAWEGDRPLPFAVLQRRIGRKRVEATFWPEYPVVFVAFDLLEQDGTDVRARPLETRRAALEALLAGRAPLLRLSPLVPFASWDELAAQHGQARRHGAEGLMLKARQGAYDVGRPRGGWWKWKSAPHTIDAVLIYAERGHGRRAGRYTDYTFGVWRAGELVPVAKAYSGLSAAEIQEVDAYVHGHTLRRRGPVRIVRPELVFELAFQGVQRSDRHRAGLALRFPRIARWRRDKRAAEADTLDALSALLAEGAR